MGLLPGRFAKKIGAFLGGKIRQRFAPEKKVKQFSNLEDELPFSLYYFCSNADKDLLAVSLYSFVKEVGIPKKVKIVSDGSLKDLRFLDFIKQDERLELVSWEELVGANKALFGAVYDRCLALAQKYKRIRKTLCLRVISSLQGWYTDSDILFFEKFRLYLPYFQGSKESLYSVDNDWGCLDQQYLGKNHRKGYQVNYGFLIFCGDLDWTEAMQYLMNVDGEYDFFDQTTIQVLVDSNPDRFQPLDPRVFSVSTADHFLLKFRMPNLCLRHFVRPIRHKFWQLAYVKYPQLFD